MRNKRYSKLAKFKNYLDKVLAHPEYGSIIESARNRGLNKPKKSDQKYDLHHIVPKSLGGYDYKYNLVLLTHKEHIRCHEILHEIFPEHSKLMYAYGKMTNQYEELAEDKKRAHLQYLEKMEQNWQDTWKQKICSELDIYLSKISNRTFIFFDNRITKLNDFEKRLSDLKIEKTDPVFEKIHSYKRRILAGQI